MYAALAMLNYLLLTYGFKMKTKLGHIADIQIGYLLRGRLENDPQGSHAIIQMRDVDVNGMVDMTTLTCFTPERDLQRYAVRAGTVLFQSRGRANVAFVIGDAPDNVIASNHFFIVRLDSSKLLPDYLAWYLNSSSTQNLLRYFTQGTTTMLISITDFKEFEIDVPPLDVQQKIVRIDELRRKEELLMNKLTTRREKLIESTCLQAARRKD